MKIPIDRPIFYGIFIKYLSLMSSLWYVIFFQSIILSLLIYLLFREFFSKNTFGIYYLISLFILTFTTGISFNVSMLTPDIFTSFLFITFYLILFGKNLSKFENVVISIIFIFSLFTHNSHFFILFIVLGILLLLFALRNRIIINFPFSFNRFVSLLSLFILSIVLFPIMNYLIDKKFIFSQATHVFLMHKMHDDSILQPYLQENCEKNKYYICDYKDNLPWDLIWDSKSPITKDGDWNKYKHEDNEILIDILTTYKYSKMFFLKSFHQTFKQFFSFSTGDAPSGEMTKPSEIEINKYFNDEMREFLVSRQVLEKIDFKSLNHIQIITIFLSIVSLFIIVFNNLILQDERFKMSILVLVIYLFSNAYICCTFSNVLDRYQSRVVWLLPIFALIIFFKAFEQLIAKIKAKLD